jgi:hypothetical protein
LIAGDKAGQGMAEALVRTGRHDAFDPAVAGGAAPEAQPKAISDSLRRLVEFVKFDDAASLSVLASASEGGLSDADKWNVIKVNQEFMRLIRPGLTINKIIPEEAVRGILAGRALRSEGNKIKGSVAHRLNYDQGLTGAQSVSNFGLDYGGYTDVRGGQVVKLEGGKEVADYGQWGGLSPYVKKTGTDQQGRATLQAVQNVFYVQMDIPAKDMDQVKVPVHKNIMEFAQQQHFQLKVALEVDPDIINQMREELGAASNDEVRELLQKKLDSLKKFLDLAKVDPYMLVSTKLDQRTKNEEDPLTNLGITKPGVRLENKFGTINQEYHLRDLVELPEGSGLFLKDKTGKDKQVGKLVPHNGQLQWSELKADLIQAALSENDAFRTSAP